MRNLFLEKIRLFFFFFCLRNLFWYVWYMQECLLCFFVLSSFKEAFRGGMILSFKSSNQRVSVILSVFSPHFFSVPQTEIWFCNFTLLLTERRFLITFFFLGIFRPGTALRSLPMRRGRLSWSHACKLLTLQQEPLKMMMRMTNEMCCLCSPIDAYLELLMTLHLEHHFLKKFCCLYYLFSRLKFWILLCWPFSGSTFD